ncbi:hypothetical protein [Pseudonocardia sp. H11422]|uniref:hypothetical protein n=1 Tax=Pseudonocardia sp. H11422 TaxID=2835866 RepID=UPI001BDD7B18|nr:hypothetical protein [Pseudonocardia sp. H11422]
MTDVSTFQPALTDERPMDRDREGTTMSLHEALARSRQQEAEAAARRHRLARRVSAGRRWALLARYAQGRAERARRRADTI